MKTKTVLKQTDDSLPEAFDKGIWLWETTESHLRINVIPRRRRIAEVRLGAREGSTVIAVGDRKQLVSDLSELIEGLQNLVTELK